MKRPEGWKGKDRKMKQMISSCNVTGIALSKTCSQGRNSNIVFPYLRSMNKIHEKIVIFQLFKVFVYTSYNTQILKYYKKNNLKWRCAEGSADK